MESGDRSLTLLHLRKTFSQYLKEEPRNHEQAFDKLLPLFNKIMSMYTPDELGSQFKEMIPFCNQLCTSLVSEIRRCANLENTRQAAERVYAVLRPSAECRGWTLLKSIIFIVNSGMPKVVESISKSMLPSTLVKLVYLFFDLSPLELNGVDDDKIKQEIELRQRLYDSLVMLMNSLCGHTIVAEELIQKDDLVLLFIGASTGTPNTHSNCWRDANFTFLCTIVAKALSSAVVKYVHSKGCIGYYLKNVRNSQVPEDKTVLLCNLLDLLRSSADTTSVLIEDFANAGGYDTLVSFCSGSSTEEQARQILESLRGLITAGDETIEFSQPSTPLSFYNFKLPQTLARSTATVRVSGAYLVLEKCFYAGDDWLCLLVLDTMAHLYKSEQMNYFIVDKYYSLYLFVESMVTKGVKVQEKVLELVEFVLRELNFIPCKELTALNVHIRKASIAADYEHLERWLRWLFQILPVNANVKDAFRELLVLETLLQIVQAGVGDHTLDNLTSTPRLSRDHTKAAISTQMALDLLVIATKSNVLNAQFVTENLEMKMVKTILMEETQNQELSTATLVLIKNLLYLAKNEQLFSSLLQLLFSDPGNIAMCMVVLKLFTSVLLESHKVRIMFRRSGGYICLMTLLLHLEGSLLPGKEHSQTLQYISLIFHVLTVSMRYEPSNAKYFLTEVRPNIINSILRSIGCFSEVSKVNVEHKVWEQVVLDKSRDKLSKLHILFQTCSTSKDCNAVVNGVAIVPQQICNIFYLLRLLFDLALDNYEKPSNDIRFASDQEWLRSTENLETIPLVSWSARTILVHPSAVLCLLYLLPSISQVTDCSGTTPASPSRANHEVECQLEEWHAVSQFYIALVLKALLRSERNQQIMCQHEMPSILLDVGSELFLNNSDRHHPLLSPFHYLFERLACQAMHPSELRKFLRLDQPLCCQNLDDEDEENAKPQHYNINGGGPVPIHRVKALVSMLTPRNHSLVHPPAFVEFDLAVEGFACLFVPCIVNPPTLHSPSPTDRTFPPANGLTFLTWIYLDDSPVPTSPKIQMHQFLNQPINLISLVRNYESNEIHRRKSHMAIDTSCSLENYLTCFIVQLNMVDRAILVSTAEHSVVDELRKDFSRPPDTFVSVPLSEQFWNFHSKQWTHVAVVLSRQKGGQVEVFVNGKLLASQKINYVQMMGGGGQGLERQLSGGCAVHGIVGTPPFLRRATCLRWKMASMYLVDEPMSGELVKKVASMQPHYVGNLQTSSSSDGALVPEDKLLLSLNAISTTEVTAQNLRSMIRKTDCETIASLLGISPTDSSTPIRILWNTVPASASNKSIGAIVVGYLGMRTFAPCPVSALLDSIGGLAPLLGLVAMCSDSHGLYASLKVLVSAVLTNRSIVNTIVRTRGYQTLAMLLEEKAHLINSHILHLVLSLAGTVDGSKTDESAVIPNLQTFDDLLCDLDVWANAPDEVKKLLFEHFYELVIDNHKDNLSKVRTSSLLSRLLIFIFENSSLFPVKNDIVFRLIGAIVQPPCDQHSLLRLGQTISATSSSQPNGDEKEDGGGQYPFHIAELERLLLDEHNSGMEINRSVYCIYVRNRLLNMIMTTLAHSSGQVNKELSESLVNTLGFGWIVSLCAPGVHPGTLFLALKILVSVTKYPLLLDKFREGSCFSVSAHGGAVDSYVDINPELSHCSGFAALEHLIFDLVHVFALNEKSSVALAIQNVTFCPDVLIPILAMVRAGLHYHKSEEDPKHWSQNYPLMVLQLIAFLYQNSEAFFLICHTEAFVVSLFTTLIPPIVHQPAAPLMQITTFAEQNKQNSLDLSPTSAGSSGRCVRNILEQLTNILLNDLCLSHDFNNERLFDALVEYLDGGGSMCSQQSVLFTELINACLDRFMSSNMFFANSTCMQGMPFQAAESQLLSPSSETTAINVVYFLSRVIDSVWNCLYRGNPIRILKCFLKLLAESHASNKAAAQLNCNEAHTTALFRIVLYLLSRPIDNVDTQMSVLDTLAEIVRNQHLLLAPLKQANSSIQQQGHNSLFYGALVHLVFMLSEKPDIHHHHQKNSHLERGSAQVAMCAQTVWGMLWQQKKAILDDIFKRDVDLELYTARAVCGEQANRFWLQFVDSQTDGSNSTLPSSQPNSAKFSIGASGSSGVGQIQSKLTKVARSGLQNWSGTQQPVFQFDRMNRIEPETFYMWIRVHISLLNELMKNHSQRYHEWHQHVRKWCMQEWHNTEAELTRNEDYITEGPHRIRKKLVPNNTFYQQYPYRPALDVPEAKAQRAKVAISKDSKLYYEKMQKKRFHTMDERIVDHSKVVGTAHAAATAATVANNNNAQQQDEQSVHNMLDLTSELNLSMIKRMVQKNLPNISATSSKDKKSSNEKLKEEDEEEEMRRSAFWMTLSHFHAKLIF
uniref:WD repeat and FYVE domain-containing protein 3 n=1 Tax=Ditylenchus dipsaci TaxID=166011 RepID=A0A915E805_9BILA